MWAIILFCATFFLCKTNIQRINSKVVVTHVKYFHANLPPKLMNVVTLKSFQSINLQCTCMYEA